MTVAVAIDQIPYEGDTFVGAWATRDEAMQAIRKMSVARSLGWKDEERYLHYHVPCDIYVMEGTEILEIWQVAGNTLNDVTWYRYVDGEREFR